MPYIGYDVNGRSAAGEVIHDNVMIRKHFQAMKLLYSGTVAAASHSSVSQIVIQQKIPEIERIVLSCTLLSWMPYTDIKIFTEEKTTIEFHIL